MHALNHADVILLDKSLRGEVIGSQMIPELPYKVENMLIEKHIYDDGTFKT
jgi:hypothetical protein